MVGSSRARYAAAIFVLTWAPGISAAQHVTGYYIEGALGYSAGPEAQTDIFSGAVANLTFTSAGLLANYDNDVSYGVEVGLTTRSSFRFGLGVTNLEFDINSLSGTGTVDTGTNVFDLSRVTVSREELGPGGAGELRTVATLYSVNSYYDFDSAGGAIPFVGGGLGFADIEDTRSNAFTASFYAGVTVPLRSGFYVGGRLSHHHVDGPTGHSGISYDDFGVTGLSLLVGLRF
jgi:opacity protein-like surface antigen